MRVGFWVLLAGATLAVALHPAIAQADDNYWSPLPGPTGGVFSVVAISPNYGQDKTLFAASRPVFANGLFRSTDGGVSWKAPPGANFWSVSSIAISPNFGRDGTLFAATDWGVYKSSDGGENWTAVIPGQHTLAVAVSPTYSEDGLVLAGAWQAYYDANPAISRSTDGGKTWSRPGGGPGGSIQHIAFSLNFATDGTVLVATYWQGVFKSTDGGKTWVELSGSPSKGAFVAFAPSYGQDSTVFLGTHDKGLWKSTDGAATWSLLALGDTSVLSIVFSPAYPVDGTLYISTNGKGALRSRDGGATWQAINNGLPETNVPSLALSPSFHQDRTLFAVSVGSGVYKSTDGGDSWQEAKQGLVAFTFYSLAVSPDFQRDPTIAAMSGHIFMSEDGGQTWSVLPKPTAYTFGAYDLPAFSPDYARDGTLFAGGDAVYRSTDRGRTWTKVGPQELGVGVSRVVLSPAFASDRTIFAATAYWGLYKSTDGGESWQYLGFRGTQSGYNIRGVAISPSYQEDRTLFLVHVPNLGQDPAKLYKSTDGGQGWDDVTPEGLSQPSWLGGVALSPDYARDQTVLVGPSKGRIFRSTDAGRSWKVLVPSGLRDYGFQKLVFSPNYRNDGTIFMSTLGGGILRSKDGGNTWQPMSGGLSTGRIWDLAIGAPFTLFAATEARGIWEYRYQPGYEAEFVGQYYPARMRLGEERQAWVALRNTGDWTWQASGEHPVRLGTSEPRDRTSPFFRPGAWEAPNRPARLERDTPPGEVGMFSFLLRAPDAPGSYREFFRPVAESVTWFNDLGIYFQITVTKELALSHDSLLFITPRPGQAPLPQTLQVAGIGQEPWSISVSPPVDWLAASPLSGTLPLSPTFSVNVAALTEGSYTTTVTVRAGEGVEGSPQTIPVRLIVGTSQRTYLSWVARNWGGW